MVEAKKSLGQHWLKDDETLKEIATVASLGSSDVVLEVGPGHGTLTKYLTSQAKLVVAVELDKELARALASQNHDRLEVVQADILKFDLSSLPPDYKVVANIPYYLTGHLLRLLATSNNPPRKIVLLVQKEVAQRIAAGPGSMSILAVSLQLFYEVKLGQLVPAELFTPPPKVDSQVVIMTRRSEPLFKDLDASKFMQIVRAGFSSPRKKLRSSLSAGLQLTKEETDQLLAEAEVNGNLRAQRLSLKQWHAIYMRYMVKNDLSSLL